LSTYYKNDHLDNNTRRGERYGETKESNVYVFILTITKLLAVTLAKARAMLHTRRDSRRIDAKP
jgi:hypothetical protein